MPYGVAKEHGGDSAENDARMESCVAAVMKHGNSTSSAIAICKAKLFAPKGKGSRGR